MEAYKTTCKDCRYTRFWMGYKTGLGKTDEQLKEMERERTTCVQCGSDNVETGLDHESEAGQVLDAQSSLLASVLERILRGEI